MTTPRNEDEQRFQDDVRAINHDPMRPFPGWGWVLLVLVAVLVGWWLL